MRRNISKRMERLEERAGIGPNPPPTIIVLFPDGDSKQRPSEGPAEYHARLDAQLVSEGHTPPFKVIVFANPPHPKPLGGDSEREQDQ